MKMLFFENCTIHFNAQTHNELCILFFICFFVIGKMRAIHLKSSYNFTMNLRVSARVCVYCGREQT